MKTENDIVKYGMIAGFCTLIMTGCYEKKVKQLPKAPQEISRAIFEKDELLPQNQIDKWSNEEEAKWRQRCEEAQACYNDRIEEWRKEHFLSVNTLIETIKRLNKEEQNDYEFNVFDKNGFADYEGEAERIEADCREQIAKWEKDVKTMFSDDVFLVEFRKLLDKRAKIEKIGNLGMFMDLDLDINWDLWKNPPEKGIDSSIDDIRDEIEAELSKKLKTEERIAKLPEEAEKKYAMFKIREKAVITISKGKKNPPESIQGYLMNVTPERVQIGTRFIIRNDLTYDSESRLYPEINKKAKADYIKNEKRKITNDLVVQVTYEMAKEVPKKLIEYGYIPDPLVPANMHNLAKGIGWISMSEFIHKCKTELLDMQMKNIYSQKINQYMTEKNYIWVDGNQDGKFEWMTRELIKAFYQIGNVIETRKRTIKEVKEKAQCGFILVRYSDPMLLQRSALPPLNIQKMIEEGLRANYFDNNNFKQRNSRNNNLQNDMMVKKNGGLGINGGNYTSATALKEAGFYLLIPMEARRLERESMQEYMTEKGFSPEEYIQDTAYWKNAQKVYNDKWVNENHTAISLYDPDDTSYLDY